VLRLRPQTFPLCVTQGQTLYVVTAAPGSRDEQALARLATAAADLDATSSLAGDHDRRAAAKLG
jgi:hypothetical protein